MTAPLSPGGPVPPAGLPGLDLAGAGGGKAPAPAGHVEIVAYGRPAPQGSKNAFRNRHTGRIQQVESSKAVKPWREAVKSAVLDMLRGGPPETYGHAPWPLDGPLEVRMVFTLPKPRSAPKRRRTWPDRTPDLSKLCRATEDALTDVGVWADDARVVEYQRLAKVFPGEDPEALHVPGVRIALWQVQP